MFLIILLPINYFIGTLTWGVFFSMLLVIAIFFLIARFDPKLPIVSYLREIHLSNLEDAEDFLSMLIAIISKSILFASATGLDVKIFLTST